MPSYQTRDHPPTLSLLIMPTPKKKTSKASTSKPKAAKPSSSGKARSGKAAPESSSGRAKSPRGKKRAPESESVAPAAPKAAEVAPTKRMGESDAADDGTHRRFPTVSMSDPAETRSFAIDAARMAADDRCEDIVLLDVRGLSQLSDYILVASGTSDRQMHSTAEDIRKLAAARGYNVFRSSSDDRTTWIVVDCVDFVAHIFEPNTRAHYDLEMLWADAEKVAWERPDQANRDRAGLH